MRHFEILLALVICLGAQGVLSNCYIENDMEDYIRQNQKQYDTKMNQLDNELNVFRDTYGKQLRAIDVQSNSLQVKMAETTAYLDPLELIDSWHKQCVQNYSSDIPLVSEVRTNLTTCLTTAQSNLNSILSSSQNTYNNMKNYYNSNLKKFIADCRAKNTCQQNYTICITNVITTANTYTVTNQNYFNTYMQQAKCTADTRITQAWECAFATVYKTSSILGKAVKLINDCIDTVKQSTCASCTPGCTNTIVLRVNETNFDADRINNPFIGFNNTDCVEVRFKH